MNGLLYHWLHSFSMLHPSFLLKFMARVAKNFAAALVATVYHFPWVLGLDVVFVALFGGKIIHFMIKALSSNPVSLHPLLAVSMLVVSVMTFLMQLFFILFLRRDHFLLNPRVYIQAYVFKYVQFVFFVAFATALLRILLFFGGIVQMPHVPELVLFFTKVFTVFALFFWLDSAHTIRSLGRSFERAANLCVYTLPFMFFVAALSFGALALLVGTVLGWDKVLQAPYVVASFEEFFVKFGTEPAIWQMIAIKYGRFIIEGLTLSFLYTWYRRKRSVMYAASLFEEPVES